MKIRYYNRSENEVLKCIGLHEGTGIEVSPLCCKLRLAAGCLVKAVPL